MRAKLSENLISFISIRRGNWIIKVSIYKSSSVMIVGQHCFEYDKFFVKQFDHHERAADFLEDLAKEDSNEY